MLLKWNIWVCWGGGGGGGAKGGRLHMDADNNCSWYDFCLTLVAWVFWFLCCASLHPCAHQARGFYRLKSFQGTSLLFLLLKWPYFFFTPVRTRLVGFTAWNLGFDGYGPSLEFFLLLLYSGRYPLLLLLLPGWHGHWCDWKPVLFFWWVALKNFRRLYVDGKAKFSW